MNITDTIHQTSHSPSSDLLGNVCTAELAIKEHPTPTVTPTLDEIVRAICLDAQYDSLKFILRSNTGHDGE